MNQILLEAKHLKKYFQTPNGLLHAVDDVSFALEKGRTLGVVGESGCGKSTLGRMLVHLLPLTDGEIYFESQNISKVDKKRERELHKEMQMVFQDPYGCLDPRMSVGRLIEEPLKHFRKEMSREERNRRVEELMDTVGLARRFINSYPHELDGGRCQRIGIARALALEPKFIVCDEPVSALDVSIQAQILNLMMDLQEKMGHAYIFITHDLSVVKYVSQDIMVMYLGQCVEKTSTEELFRHPMHHYTKALLAAIPLPDPKLRDEETELIRGEVTSPINPPPGCRFAARCPFASEKCWSETPALEEISSDHFVACFYPERYTT